MYTTINGIYEKGQVFLQEPAPTEKSMRVLVIFIEENKEELLSKTTVKQAVKTDSNKSFSERWQSKFKLNDKTDDARLDYLKQHYQL